MTVSQERPVVYVLDASISVTGAFVAASNIAQALSDVADTVLVLPFGSTIPAEALGMFRRVEYMSIGVPRSMREMLLFGPTLMATALTLRWQIGAKRPTQVVLNDFYLMQGVALRVLGFRGRIVSWIRFDPRRLGVIGATLLRIAALTSSKLVAVSRFTQAVLPPSMTALLLYDPVRPTQVPGNGGTLPLMRNRLVCVGNYIEGKGQDDALAAFARMAAEHPDLRLEFYGGDMGLEKNRDYLARLQAKAGELGLTQRVTFNGFLSNTGLALEGALAAINCSHSETFSMTVLEACASGLPVVATRSGGPAEIIDEGRTGWLVPVGDIAAIADAFRRVALDRSAAAVMGERGKALIAGRFSREQFRRELFDVLEFPLPALGSGLPR